LIAAGQSIGNYRILAKIGTGGMGAVYLAEHPLIGKKVALKVIHRELAGNREVVQRFFQEAKAVNQIGNEHIVEIHDFGVTPDNDHFYIMEYLEGRTLASVLASERTLDIMRALHIGTQIASALASAHASQVIHRDLKPDNIMLMRRLGDPDFVKVLDFGLAKMFAAGASSVKTAAGVLLGTPQYMSPEACESKRDIDHRTDIYALGILLFQMLTGVLPFDGESMGEVLVKQVTALPPAPRGFNPAIPPSVEQILLRCLAKPVDARFQTMVALREALLDPEAYLRGSPPIAPARSLAPGEAKADAKTVMAHAAAMQARKAAGAEPWQVAPTIMTDGHAVPGPVVAPVVAMSAGKLMPELAQPIEPKNQTMRIATPLGHSSRPSRRMWPIVLVLGLLLGLGGGAFAVAWIGRGEPDPALAASAADAAVIAPADGAVDAAPPAARTPDARPPSKPDVAKLTIDSVPPGASVFGPDGSLLGKTRLELTWPISPASIGFELRLPGYRKKPKQIVITGNTTVGVELEKLPAASGTPHGPGRGSGAGHGSSDTGLIRPGD
jgi:serine/threonine-protein kinase